jgi:hypothetical protein
MLLSPLILLLSAANVAVHGWPLTEAAKAKRDIGKRLFIATYTDDGDAIEGYPAYVEAADPAAVLGESQDLVKRIFIAEYVDGPNGEEAIEGYPAYVEAADAHKVLGDD